MNNSRRSILFIFFVLNATSMFCAVKIDDPYKEAQAKTYFAINGTKVFHIPNEMNTIVAGRMEWMKELGVLWDRSDWWWHIIEPEPGKFDFTIPDKVVKFFEENHIQIYPILCYGAKWWKDRTAPLKDEEFEQYANYVYETVKRYKDHFTYWSVWNEPNILPFWAPEPNADHYAKLLKLAYKSAKRADPDCKICAPAIAPLGTWDKKFVERLYQLGCKDYFDVFDYHYYRHSAPEPEVPDEIADIKALMHRYGDKKPIWISETGVSSPIKEKEKSYPRQAAYIVRNHLLCLASGVERIFYFDLQNWFDSPDASWDSYLGLVEAGGEKKPSFYAYKTMVKEVNFKKVVGRYRVPKEDLEAVLIYDEKIPEYILAVWLIKEDEKKKIKFICEAKNVKIVHPYGEEEILPFESTSSSQTTREIIVEIDQNPRYIHSVDKFMYLPEAAIRLIPEKIYVNPGEKQKICLDIHPLVGDRHACPLHKLEIVEEKIPEGIKWNSKTGRLKIGKDVQPGMREIKIVAEVNYGDKSNLKKMRIERTAKIEVLPILSLNLRPYIEGNNLKVQATVNNQSVWKLSGSISLDEVRATIVKTQRIASLQLSKCNIGTLKPNETKRMDISLDREIMKNYREPTVWKLKFKNFESKPFRIHSIPFRNSAPVIDANLEEWKDVPQIFINSKEQITRGPEGWNPKEASGDVRFWFTPEALFIAADVIDDEPIFNNNPANLIWKGDAIELYLGFGGPAKRTVIDKSVDFQVGLAPNYEKNEPVAFLFHKDIIIEDAKIATRKTDDGYILEAMIPLKTFGDVKLKDGMLIGLDAAINDLDSDDWAPAGNEPGRALMWNGTEMNWIDPSNWGMAILHKR